MLGQLLVCLHVWRYMASARHRQRTIIVTVVILKHHRFLEHIMAECNKSRNIKKKPFCSCELVAQTTPTLCTVLLQTQCTVQWITGIAQLACEQAHPNDECAGRTMSQVHNHSPCKLMMSFSSQSIDVLQHAWHCFSKRKKSSLRQRQQQHMPVSTLEDGEMNILPHFWPCGP
jgi:hypothetical protein